MNCSGVSAANTIDEAGILPSWSEKSAANRRGASRASAGCWAIQPGCASGLSGG